MSLASVSRTHSPGSFGSLELLSGWLAGHALQALAPYAARRSRSYGVSASSRSKASNTSPNTTNPPSTTSAAREPNDSDPLPKVSCPPSLGLDKLGPCLVHEITAQSLHVSIDISG